MRPVEQRVSAGAIRRGATISVDEKRVARLVVTGVNVIVLLALTDTGRPSYDPQLSARVAALGIPVFACTPDQFPELMATALRREDVSAWAADRGIKLVRSDGG
jgi:hypothetical protein